MDDNASKLPADVLAALQKIARKVERRRLRVLRLVKPGAEGGWNRARRRADPEGYAEWRKKNEHP